MPNWAADLVANVTAGLQELNSRLERVEQAQHGVDDRAFAGRDGEPASGKQLWGDYSSDGGSVYSSDDSDASTRSGEYRPAGFVPVDPAQPQWRAADRARDADQEPRRSSLYGYEPFDMLNSSKHGGGGTLGMAMSYAEPACLYQEASLRKLDSIVEAIDPSDPLHRELSVVYNSLDAVFNLFNQFRTLIVERAKVVRPGATPGEKRRQRYVESQLHEDDYADANTDTRVREFKAAYEREASKQDLRKAAAAGSASGGGGYDRGSKRDGGGDHDRGSSRASRRRERRRQEDERERGRNGDRRDKLVKFKGERDGAHRDGDDRRRPGAAADKERGSRRREEKPERGSRRGASRSPPPRRGDGKRAAGSRRGGGYSSRDDGRDRRGAARPGRGSRRRGSGDDDDGFDSDTSWSESES